MGKRWIVGIGLSAVAIALLGFAACMPAPAGNVYAGAHLQQTEDAAIAELQQTIAELRALVSLLLGSDFYEGRQQAGIPSISGQRAREIAVELVGYGEARDVLLFSDDGALKFEVDVRYLNRRYMVYIDAASGEFISISRFDDVMPGFEPGVATTPPKVSPSPSPHASPSPSLSPGQTGRPINPAISLERAIEIGYEELARRGHTGSFRNHSGMDLERGQWVWELLFNVQGGRLPFVEMYISVDTGAIIKFEWDD